MFTGKLSPLKRDRHNHFSTLDIETSSNGDVLDIGVWDGINYFLFPSFLAFLEWLQTNCIDERYRKFIAFNGGNFDWVSFVEVLKDQKLYDSDIIAAQSTIISIRIGNYEKPVLFLDGAKVLVDSTLHELCDTFQVENPKQDIPEQYKSKMEIFKKKFPEKYYEYLKYDCISLYEVSIKFMKLLNIDFFPTTLASLSLYLYRLLFQEYDLYKLSETQDNFISESYGGGRTECFRPGSYSNVKEYDFNSMYPAIMKNAEIPVRYLHFTYNHDFNNIGFYEIDFKQNDNNPSLLWIKTKEHGMEYVKQGHGIFASPEVDKAIKLGYTIKIIKGYVCRKYKDTRKIFNKWIDYSYNTRKKNKTNALDYIFKKLMNTGYGKFGQKRISQKVIINKNMTIKKLMKKYEEVKPYMDKENGIYIVTEKRECHNRIVSIASLITSAARVKLYESMEKINFKMVYTDTDSLHMPNYVTLETSTELGELKLEDSGEGIYIGRKLYYFKGDKKTKKKVKGVKIGGSFGAEIEKEDFEKLLAGETLKRTNKNFPKFRSVLRGTRKAAKIFEVEKEIKQNFTSNWKPD